MKKVSSVLVLTILILALGVQSDAMPVPALSASPVAQQDSSQPQGDSGNASDVRVFTGKVMQSHGQYVLLDSITKATYALDDQDKAKQFEGKAVKVTGTLEATSKLIHVSNIEPAA
jgi:hypothetical protein